MKRALDWHFFLNNGIEISAKKSSAFIELNCQ